MESSFFKSAVSTNIKAIGDRIYVSNVKTNTEIIQKIKNNQAEYRDFINKNKNVIPIKPIEDLNKLIKN